MSSRANQKEGMAKPRKTRTVTVRSSRELRRQAEIMPTGMAMARVRSRETRFMPTVRGRRSRILVSTGLPSADMELPKSRCNRRTSQSQYCTYRGRSSP